MTSLFRIFSLMQSLSKQSGATLRLYLIPLVTLGIVLTRSVSNIVLNPVTYRGTDKSLARPGRKQATATEGFDVHIVFLALQPVVVVFSTAPLFSRFLDHTQRRATVGRAPLDGLSVRRRDLYLTTHNTHNRQTSTPPGGFEPRISAGERPKTYALDRTATGTGF
jgi:hypothetical protein